MIDSAMADGEAEPGEQRLIMQFAEGRRVGQELRRLGGAGVADGGFEVLARRVAAEHGVRTARSTRRRSAT
jgi:hypothetical protein